MSDPLPPPSSPRLCGCGCGVPVVRRYCPGHDARHKAALVAQAVASQGLWAGEAAAQAVFAAGWESYLPLSLLRDLPIRNARRQVRIPLPQVERFLVDPTGQHHARHNCQLLTRTARKLGLINPLTRLACQSAIVRVDPTPSLLRSLPSSFAACHECTIDWSWDEVIETQATAKAVVLDAIDHTLANWKPRVLAPTKRSSLPYTTEPDPIPCLILPLVYSTFPFLLIPPTTRVDLRMEAA